MLQSSARPQGLFMARALACAKSSAKRTSPPTSTDGRAACGFRQGRQRIHRCGAKRRCSNSLAANGAKCNAINAKRPSSNPPRAQNGDRRARSQRKNTQQRSSFKKRKSSRTVEFKTEIANLEGHFEHANPCKLLSVVLLAGGCKGISTHRPMNETVVIIVDSTNLRCPR